VDVPGSSLQLVVIDRIPFPRPDDPLASARQRAVAAHGGNGFMTVAASHAPCCWPRARAGCCGR
jgi:ATP-dependent DNA helicase DinG